ncbi:MAG: hypothetical protein GC179_11330 [Anaerolineaceae bacterium]|nr:hypothetical protein [Anaerolineaceae bacterium]
MNNTRKLMMMLTVMIALVLTMAMLAMPVFAQNQPPHTPIPTFTSVPNQQPHTPVPTTTATVAPTAVPLIITMTQDEITTAFTPIYSTQLINVVVTLGEGQVFVDFEGTGPDGKRKQFNAVAVPQYVEIVGKVTWIVTAMTMDGNEMSSNLFTLWGRRVHNMLDARMPKRYKGYVVTNVEITPDLLTYTQVLR